MSGQIAQTGAQALCNYLGGSVPPYIGSSAPTWVPGLYWINTSSSATVYSWNGSSWISGADGRYIALLTADPLASGPGGGFSVNISDLVEVTTPGYTRQAVTFSDATAAYPSEISNTAPLTFGPMNADMALSAQWAAMVTVVTGNSGILLQTWALDTPQQVSVSQAITIPSGDLVLDGS